MGGGGIVLRPKEHPTQPGKQGFDILLVAEKYFGRFVAVPQPTPGNPNAVIIEKDENADSSTTTNPTKETTKEGSDKQTKVFPEMLKLSGGAIEPGEMITEGIEREVWEECGVSCKCMGILTVSHTHDFRFANFTHFLDISAKYLIFSLEKQIQETRFVLRGHVFM